MHFAFWEKIRFADTTNFDKFLPDLKVIIKMNELWYFCRKILAHWVENAKMLRKTQKCSAKRNNAQQNAEMLSKTQ